MQFGNLRPMSSVADVGITVRVLHEMAFCLDASATDVIAAFYRCDVCVA